MEVSVKATANKSGKTDPYLITDADMAFLNPKLSYYSQDFENRFRKSIFHKYFLNGIEKVKEDKSRHVLLIKLHQQLDTGIYHFPITDIDPLYECIFETLLKLEPFRTNSTIMDELFAIMNIFMFRFYDAAYPFFYDFTAEGNIFTFGPIFVINYFRQFSIRFEKLICNSDRPYLNLLEHDGSLTNILNYFFDQYTKGVELPLLSDCIYNLMKCLNCHFLRDYLTQKKFFKTGTSIFVNSNIKVSIRMDFLIAFYNNYFENHYEKISTPFLKITNHNRRFTNEEEIPKKAVIAQGILDDIKDLKIKNYLESYLSSYIDQLISEGRLLNTVNPLESKKDNLLNDSMTFYPPKAEDEYIFHLFDLLVIMFRLIGQDELPDELYTNYHNCIFDFIPIISTIYKVIPGVFLSDWNKWTMILFDISRETNSNVFEILKDTFFEIIQMRISGDFLYNLNCHEMINMLSIEYDKLSGQKEIIKDINQTAISSYVRILFSRPDYGKEPFIDLDLFFSTIKFSSLDSTIEWFNTIINKMKEYQMKNIISKATIKYLGKFSTEPKFIECVLDLFDFERFYEYSDYEDLNEKGIILYFFKLFIEKPDLQKSILPSKFYAFCDSIGKYIIHKDLLNEEVLNTVIKTNNIFGIKLFSIVLKYGSEENYQLFIKRIIDDVINKSMKITLETIDEQIIKQIILISPFLTTIKFNDNETMFNIFKASLDYLNNFDQIQHNLINIEEYQDDSQLKFDPLVQSRVNIIYALTNSFGFTAVDDYLSLINYFLKGDYGMCIEVLNVISNIIGFLVDHLRDENISSKISATNETIFKIINILIENTPKDSYNFNNQQLLETQDQKRQSENEEKRSRFERSFGISRQNHSCQKSVLKFALYPLRNNKRKKKSKKNKRHIYDVDDDEEQNQIIYSYLYSFRMGGQKVDDSFGYELNYKEKNKHDFKDQSLFAVNLFIRNITNYVINILQILGIKPETINIIKQIIMISIKNGLIQVPTLETFLNFVISNPNFFINEEEANNWMSGIAERSSFLMSSSQSEEDESIELEIGNKKDQLKLIFRFFYNMNQKIFPGCLTDELIKLMFKNSSFSQESFLEFINSDEAEMDTSLNEFFNN